jgi:hypothetical protein
LLSSEQPERPTPMPMARTPIIVRLISFLMEIPLIVRVAAAGNLP